MDIQCLTDLYTQFSQLAEQGRFATFAQFFRGVNPGVISRSNSLVEQQESWTIRLQLAQVEMDFWILLHCSG